MSDAQERTEQATEKRMKEARSKGRLAKSTDLTAWVGVGAAAVMLPFTLQTGSNAAVGQLFAVRSVIESPDPAKALAALGEGLGSIMATIGPLLGVGALAVVGAAAVQGGIHFKKLEGKYEQFNVVKGLGRVFGMRALWEGAKTLLKSAVVGIGLFLVVQGLMPVLLTSGSMPLASLLSAASGGTAGLLQAAIGAGLVLAGLDVLVVMRRNRKHTRMSKQEVRDENKNSEGDPLVRSHRRSRQLAMSRNRMIAAIGGADVVLVNPTHIAVAVKYEPGKSAPRVVAKGAGAIALRIREKAEAERVPIVKDIPLARALHAGCEIGEEIPVELYNSVARVLAFVMSLKQRGSAAGFHTMRPQLQGGLS
ncbi:EscU/YscU/HrcU family type III secretion system export apparatus switch protein [Leifsonia sp. C5G2]|uniref:EscU/YscU/HrcU family type III secretion system export apparatus switch protein n=1 Tax=Leifsonia sp. C5G2 TaxID=2735269 RepID=UPI0015859DA2|nr:EscU/YscU/HrcU family type III secretion system export apparatus switch protein [Leifsonia sp. C5G2]NUU06335.1 EscU/YscU/HrcU family type III secretion system export apparatus switch protein [Leifsonia sp. C5G2]